MRAQLCLSLCVSLACFAADDTKLKLLAGPENERYVSRIVRSLRDPNTGRAKYNDFLVVGPPRNGKKSLGKEIARQAGGDFECFDFDCAKENIESFDEFTKNQIQSAQHGVRVAILTRIVFFSEYMPYIDGALKRMREAKNICVIATGPQGSEETRLGDYFSQQIFLNRPSFSHRKDILTYYLAQEWASDEFKKMVAQETDGISTGKLKTLTDVLQELHEDDHRLDQEEIMQLIHTFVLKKDSKIDYRLAVRWAAIAIPFSLLLAGAAVQICKEDSTEKRSLLSGLLIAKEGSGYICEVLNLLFTK